MPDKAYYWTHKEQIVKQNKEWKDKHRQQTLAQRRRFYLNHRIEIIQKALLRYYGNPIQAFAQRKTRKIRPHPVCEFCGEDHRLEKHHPDYSEPMIVVTVCRFCHRWIHHSMGVEPKVKEETKK